MVKNININNSITKTFISFSSWICIPPNEKTQVYLSSDEPEVILRDSLESIQTEEFKIFSTTKSKTVRLSSSVCPTSPQALAYIHKFQAGINITQKKFTGKPVVIELKETALETLPFTFENNCSDLVLKVKQEGEKQVTFPNVDHSSTLKSFSSAGY